MKLTSTGKVSFNGAEYDNPLDFQPYPKRNYLEGKESARVSFRRIWIDGYTLSPDGEGNESYYSSELKVLSNGKATLDGRELKGDELANAREIFDNLQIGT